MKKQVYMGTTKIAPQQTAAEIISELVRAGANSINTEYSNGKISGIRWLMRVRGTDCLFEMPIRIEPLNKKIDNLEQAERTAWRQLLRWVQAQNAMIEVGMAEAGEVYFAYMVNPSTNRTIFNHLVDSQFKALPAPTKQ
jgi:hypothetical protein